MEQKRRAAPGNRGTSGGRSGRGRVGRGGRSGPRFSAARLADHAPSDTGTGISRESSPLEDLLDAVEEEDQESQVKPYTALLQSFYDVAVPKTKRRKLNHQKEDERKAEEYEADHSEDEENDVDFVEPEADREEEVEDGIPEAIFDDDEEDMSDPFDSHFANPDEDFTSKRIKTIQGNRWVTKRSVTKRSRVASMFPEDDAGCESAATAPVTTPHAIKLKKRLQPATEALMPGFDEAQADLAPVLFNYQDIFYCQRTVENSESLRRLVCLHALNHVFKTRDRVLKNNRKLAKEGEDTELEFRDQGFTRPKVLFLLPTRQSCVRMINNIIKLCEPEQQENRKRFEEAYVDKESTFGKEKPADFKDLFDGNDDDMFRLGVMFTRKTLKFFAPFYRSDIILASPLGLRMAVGSEEDKKKKKMDFDFLSSIELVVVDQADALLMQNWEHVEFIFEHMNLHPREAHDYDISRVRSWYLENWAKHFRQTVVLSAFNTPELAELMRSHCHNWAGKFRLQPEYSGEIQRLGVKAQQTFSRFQSSSVDEDPDGRFSYFEAAIVPYLAKRAKDITGVLIYIPSYLDFVRVRNYFATSMTLANVSFGTISEYADVPEASRARSHFQTGRHRVLLYTERAHHFRRYLIKGVKSIIMYSLPDNPLFYREIAGGYLAKSEQDMSISPGQGLVRVMFSKYDAMKLERVVGSQRVGKMLTERGDTFDFL